jgi:hypothetical protein
MPETSPRVRPRVQVEDRVDRTAHPPRREIPTIARRRSRLGPLSPLQVLSLVLLGVAWVALPLAGLLGPLLGLWAGLGFAGLSVSSLVVSFMLGAE